MRLTSLDYLIWEADPIQLRLHGDAAVVRYQARAQATFAGRKTALGRFWHTDSTRSAAAAGKWCGRRRRRFSKAHIP